MKSRIFRVNAGLQMQYARQLRKLCRRMIAEVSRTVAADYTEAHRYEEMQFAEDGVVSVLADKLKSVWGKFRDIFDRAAPAVASEMVEKQLENAEAGFERTCSGLLPDPAKAAENLRPGETPTVKIPKFRRLSGASFQHLSPGMRDQVEAAIWENVNLIKSEQEEFFKRTFGAVTRAIQNNMSTEELAAEISRYGKMSMRRATNIALDQTRKAYTAITIQKCREAGIKKFEWVHTGGSQKPRPFHLANYPSGLNGGIFEIADPPVIEPKTGIRGFPAQLPFCKCVMRAVVEMTPEQE